jgi:hypothetical protein
MLIHRIDRVSPLQESRARIVVAQQRYIYNTERFTLSSLLATDHRDYSTIYIPANTSHA